MGWFSSDDTIGSTATQVTGGLRHLFTGEIPPEIILEMNKIDEEHVTKRWVADSKTPWYLSSRSIVFLWLNINIVVLMYLEGLDVLVLNSNTMTTMLSMVGLVNTAFVGSKGVEYMKAGKAP